MCRSYILDVDKNNSIIISDRDKDLIFAIRKNFLYIKYVYYTYYIKRNVEKRFNLNYMKLF